MLLLTSALYPVVVTQCRQYSIVAASMLHKEHSFIAPIVKVSSSEHVPKVTTRPAFVAWTPPWTSCSLPSWRQAPLALYGAFHWLTDRALTPRPILRFAAHAPKFCLWSLELLGLRKSPPQPPTTSVDSAAKPPQISSPPKARCPIHQE